MTTPRDLTLFTTKEEVDSEIEKINPSLAEIVKAHLNTMKKIIIINKIDKTKRSRRKKVILVGNNN